MQNNISSQKGNATIIASIAVVIIAIGAFLWWQQSSTGSDDVMKESENMMQDDTMTQDAMEDKAMVDDAESSEGAMKDNDVMMSDSETDNKDAMQSDDSMEKKDDTMMESNDGTSSTGSYITYSTDAYAAAADKKRVLFFHASWCPTCIVANLDFTNHMTDIPADVVVLKTDYDTYTELKKKYTITYQHTFVQVDADGEVVATWNGGGVDELIANIQ